MIHTFNHLNSVATYKHVFVGTASNVDDERAWIPVDATLYEGTINVHNQPGAGTARNNSWRNGGVGTGSIVTLSHPDTSVRDDASGLWTASTSEAAGQGKDCVCWNTGAPTFERAGHAFVYQNNDIDEGICLQGGGEQGPTIDTPTTSYQFVTFGKGGLNVASATEADWQIPWPANGKFKYAFIYYKSQTGSLPQSITFTLRIDGGDTAMTYDLPSNLSGNAQYLTESVKEAEVSQGELVSFGYKKTNGAQSATLVINYCIGFIAS
jgi:hypothetical protein